MKQLLRLLLVCATFAYTSQASAVFCTVYEYIDPTTGNSVWLFGDVHCDVDPMITMTRLQQHTLLEEAEKQNATIIAENADYRWYSPYAWIFPFGIDIALFYQAFKNSSYLWFAAGALNTVGHSILWYTEKSKTQKPSISLTTHIAQLKKNSINTSLPFYSASPLFSLVQEAEKRGIPAVNVEFRYHHIGAYIQAILNQSSILLQSNYVIAQIKHWINRKLTGNAMRYPLTLSDYCCVNDAIVAEIESYNAEFGLKDFYKKCIDDYSSSYMTIALRNLAKKNSALELATIIPTLVEQTGKDTATVLSDFAEHNMTLFDARLLHNIVNHKHTTVFACTGVYHANALVTILEQLGYQLKSVHGKDNLKTLQARGVIGRAFIQLDDLDYLAIDLDKVFAQ